MKKNVVHVLDHCPEFFEEYWNGSTHPHLFIDDRIVLKGDSILLREFNPDTKEYSGREIVRKVVSIPKSLGANYAQGVTVENRTSLFDPYRETHAKCRALTMANPEIYMQAVKYACPYCGTEQEHSAIGMNRGEWISLIDGMKSKNGIRKFCTRTKSGCPGQIKTFVVRLSSTPEYYER